MFGTNHKLDLFLVCLLEIYFDLNKYEQFPKVTKGYNNGMVKRQKHSQRPHLYVGRFMVSSNGCAVCSKVGVVWGVVRSVASGSECVGDSSSERFSPGTVAQTIPI